MTEGSLVLGVLNGLLFGLLALGIVLVYKTNRFLNLAYAQLGAVSALLLAKFVLSWHWSWWLAFVLSVLAGVGVGLLVDWALVSRLRGRTRSGVSLLLLSLGIGELLLAATYVPALGPDPDTLAVKGYPVPFRAHITIGQVVLGGQDILVMVLAPVLVVALAAFFRWSLLGKQVRAAASNPDAARLAGVSVRRVSLLTWGVAGGLSAITAILQAPSQSSFDAASLGPALLLVALGGAAFGAFTSMPWALAGGLTIGVVQQLTLGITNNAGTADVVVLGLILLVVVVRGKAIGRVFATSGAVVAQPPPVVPPTELVDHWLVRRQSLLLVLVALVVAVTLPLLPVLRADSARFELALVATYALVAVSLCVLVGWGGQISLGQFAVVGLGAFVTARLVPHDVSLLVIVLLAGLAGAVVMMVVGLPALRVPGLSLAVTTLGLAVIAPEWLFLRPWVGSSEPFGISTSLSPIVRDVSLPGGEIGVYYLAVVLVVLSVAAAAALRRRAPGRALLAVRDNETAAAAFGLTPAAVKLWALSISGFIAGTAGVVWAGAWGSVSATQFTPDLSMVVLAAPVIGGVTSLGGAVAGAVVLFGATFWLSPALSSLFGSFGQQIGFQLALGGLGIVVMMLAYPAGLAGMAHSWWRRFLVSLARAEQARRPAGDPDGDVPLVVRDATVSFGGVRALQGASIEVQRGEIVGLIGPNGAGKTTLMNVVSGTVKADRVSVKTFGRELANLGPEYRSWLGVARSFQDATLFPALTVVESVQVGLDRRHRSSVLSSMTHMPWARWAEAQSREGARQIIERLGLAAWADTLVGELSTGTRRICDLAAQVAAQPAVLLLDEPTAGVAQRDAEAFGPLLRRIRDELGCAVLVIEHDMALLMGICDRIYAMDGGRVICSGTPAEVRNDPVVIASYLGTGGVGIARSGTPASVATTAALPGVLVSDADNGVFPITVGSGSNGGGADGGGGVGRQ
jgi:ABC-type branched-subunit amino acid transport system ATPase component/ABC-type branched-subunit amino acid transport system permease subunit